ncbi:hypothetical protein DFJ43DRAFT_1095676 [Lentinula guzmanii]|uniref:Uncharacterized protein n=1 Tax=Lentinula guzmanii TaxID=2804957 RepID=A0AA38JCV8_9AGAR|nr:hypothetical protein DFJ43DRAFT_1095676 [Lentinula guzmanii]
MVFLSKFTILTSLLFLQFAARVNGSPVVEHRTAESKICGLNSAPFCPPGYGCCGPFFEPIEGNGTAYGSCYPEHGICPD